jgi:hypothetical protein
MLCEPCVHPHAPKGTGSIPVTQGAKVGAPRLPMQWGLNGKPTLFAPRLIALAFTPTLGLAIALFLLTVAASAPAVVARIVFLLLAVHLFHLWLIHRYLSGR